MKRGRQTKLNKELADSIIADRARLVPYSQVAEAHGIHRKTLREWIVKGLEELETGKTPTLFCYLARTIKKNECKSIEGLLEEIRTGEKGWQSRCWILERCKEWPFKWYTCNEGCRYFSGIDIGWTFNPKHLFKKLIKYKDKRNYELLAHWRRG